MLSFESSHPKRWHEENGSLQAVLQSLCFLSNLMRFQNKLGNSVNRSAMLGRIFYVRTS
jgi:hypothetical protein